MPTAQRMKWLRGSVGSTTSGRKNDEAGKSDGARCTGLTLSAAAQAQTTTRTELTKGDLTGTNMEIVVGTIQAAVDTSAIQHTHAGEEAFTVTGNKTLKLLTVISSTTASHGIFRPSANRSWCK
jgi:hypothetical protein